MNTAVKMWRCIIGILMSLGVCALARADIPPPRLDQPTVIHTYLQLEDINDIRLDTGTYDLTALFVMRWQDPRLRFVRRDRSNSPEVWMGSRASGKLDTVWHPILDVLGEKGLTTNAIHSLAIYPDGTVVLRQKFSGTPRFTGELIHFPFGQLSLGLTISSVAMDDSQIKFSLEQLSPSETMAEVDDILHGNWSPTDISWRTSSASRVDTPNQRFPQIDVHVTVEHDFVDGVHKILLPLSVIALASWGLLWMNLIRQAAFSSPRIGGFVTLILTTIALKFVLNRELPVVHYLTLSDVLFNGTIIMLSLALLGSCVVAALFTESTADRAMAFNVWLRRLYPLIYLVVMLIGYLTVL